MLRLNLCLARLNGYEKALARSCTLLTGYRYISSSSGSGLRDNEELLKSVQTYYGSTLTSTKSLKTSACTSSSKPSREIAEIIANVPDEIVQSFYGCGTPLPANGGLDGLTVLDLGSGSGRDAYIASKLVGPSGKVVGIDMTEKQLSLSRRYVDSYTKEVLGYPRPNLQFLKGYIEDVRGAGVADDSVDVIISNCVVNLSPNKPAVIRGMYDALRVGGEAYFSDVYCDRRLPKSVTTHDVLWGECLAGAMYVEDFLRLARSVGFADPRQVDRAPVEVTDPELLDVCGEAKFFSITYRLFKIPHALESLCEDYGQVATYLGTIAGHRHAYTLDDHHHFVTNKPMLVCGNTAAMVGESWLGKHFKVHGNRDTHFGLFPCGPVESLVPSNAEPSPGGSCC